AIKSRFLEELKSRVEQLGVGDPREKGTFVGPVINMAAVSKFRSAVREVRRRRGKILCGGHTLNEGIFGEGFYVEPTLVSGLAWCTVVRGMEGERGHGEGSRRPALPPQLPEGAVPDHRFRLTRATRRVPRRGRG